MAMNRNKTNKRKAECRNRYLWHFLVHSNSFYQFINKKTERKAKKKKYILSDAYHNIRQIH